MTAAPRPEQLQLQIEQERSAPTGRRTRHGGPRSMFASPIASGWSAPGTAGSVDAGSPLAGVVAGVAKDVAMPSGRCPTLSYETRKAPRVQGLSCAEEDSNLHPVIPDQALNLVTQLSNTSRSCRSVQIVQPRARYGRYGRSGCCHGCCHAPHTKERGLGSAGSAQPVALAPRERRHGRSNRAGPSQGPPPLASCGDKQ